AAAAWTWSILPYLQGEQDDLEDRIDRLTVFERHMPSVIAPAWAHHRYTLFVPDPESSARPSGVATHTA
ncbi:MAG: hypothetical protein LC799_31275, partial [Actinobacteria bacterium]|nr:hypothetical protein [Actinomycetota bacterium]